jgi:hypothetical protein
LRKRLLRGREPVDTTVDAVDQTEARTPVECVAGDADRKRLLLSDE